MRHIATSKWFINWQKYPISRMSIRIQQPETLDSIKCHTFPGMGSKTLDILLHYSTLQFFFVPKVLIEQALLNSFFVLCNGVKSDFMACACMSPLVWLTNFQLVDPSQLDSWPWPMAVSGRRLFQARSASQQTLASSLRRSMLMLWPATSWQPGGQGVLLVLHLVTNFPSQVKHYTYTVTIL